jgi:hypothetical protein
MKKYFFWTIAVASMIFVLSGMMISCSERVTVHPIHDDHHDDNRDHYNRNNS